MTFHLSANPKNIFEFVMNRFFEKHSGEITYEMLKNDLLDSDAVLRDEFQELRPMNLSWKVDEYFSDMKHLVNTLIRNNAN